MIVKERDASSATIAYLNRLESTERDVEYRDCIRHVKARLRANATSDHACEVIDKLFQNTPEWMVLHDLRLCVKNKMFYANHLLINDAMEFIVVDSRYINHGLSLEENGTWRACTAKSSNVIASPVNKLKRDIRFLKTHLKSNDVLPRYFGMIRPSSVKGYILINPAVRSSKSRAAGIDTSSIIAADLLFRAVWKENDHWLNKHIKPEPVENLRQVATKLEGMHTSNMPPRLMQEMMMESFTTAALDTDNAHCTDCGVGVCETVREQSFRHMEEFMGKILCTNCQTDYLERKRRFAG